MKLLTLCLIFCNFFFVTCFTSKNILIVRQSIEENSTSIFATGVSDIIKAVGDSSVVLFLPFNRNTNERLNQLFKKIHDSIDISTFLFTNKEKYYSFIEYSLKRSVETTSLVFSSHKSVISEIKSRNLAHRLSLFIFFLKKDHIDLSGEQFQEPMRIAFITHPRKEVYRVYYNQATADGNGKMKLVNWYDSSNFGLYKDPLLPRLDKVFKKLDWRILHVPVINSPPWLFVHYDNNYNNDTNNSSEFLEYPQIDSYNETSFHVIGGRDVALLKVIAEKMEFKIRFIDPPERNQGSPVGAIGINLTFSGGIGMIQRREADLFLGDIPLSWERRQAVEFTFFTLADSGAFVTHAPRKLSEALVLIRPFLWEVWPILATTILISAPALYLIIFLPIYLKNNHAVSSLYKLSQRKNKVVVNKKTKRTINKLHLPYIKEITQDKLKYTNFNKLTQFTDSSKELFAKVSWFLVNLYLKQSVEFKYHTNRARFLAITIWLGATYVLGDMYSAQLTSQLARPAKENPISSLSRLELSMRYKSYQLYVEKGSAAQSIIENGTGTFARIYDLMKKQPAYEVDSVEDGIIYILNYSSRAILGGRETLYYNTKLFGTTKFHISEKLYTRYSAIAVQNGCLFLDSLNFILMYLFEAGILDRMTNTEYEKMFGGQRKETSSDKKIAMVSELSQKSQDMGDFLKWQTKIQDTSRLEPISLRMLKGAFFVLLSGHFLSTLFLILETFEFQHRCIYRSFQRLKKDFRKVGRICLNLNIEEIIHRYI